MTVGSASQGAVESLTSKSNYLNLTETEEILLDTILSRSAEASTDEVEGFGWDEGVAAITAGRARNAAPIRIDVARVAGSLGISAELGAGIAVSPRHVIRQVEIAMANEPGPFIDRLDGPAV